MEPVAITLPSPGLAELAEIIHLAVAPVFLFAGLGAFLNVCAGRLARIVDRSRLMEPAILASRGAEHDRLIEEIRHLDHRIVVVNRAIFATVLSALLVSAVVIMLFVAALTGWQLATLIAWMFILAMISTGTAFAIFLYETRLGTRSVRVRSHILDHRVEGGDDD